MPFDPGTIRTSASQPKKGGRSEIFWAMWENYAELAPTLNLRGANWEAVAAGINLRDGNGNAPTKTTMQKTWAKVRKAKGHPGRRRRKRARAAFVRAACK